MIFGVQVLPDHIVDMSVWLIVDDLPLFVFDYFLFLGKHRVSDSIDKETKFVRFGPDYLFKGVSWNGLKIIGSVTIGRAAGPGTTYLRAEPAES